VSHTPFKQGRFADLPERPRRSHAYERARSEEHDLDSAPFGRVRVHVRRMGSGPPLLLLHGLMTSSYSWRYVLEPLAAHFEVIAPDLPGAGASTPCPDRVHSAEALATFIGEVQRTLHIEGCAAIGNSLGGYLCLRRVVDDPTAFSRLVLLHPPAFPDFRLRALNFAFKLPGTRRLLRALVHRDPIRWAHRNVHYHDESLKSLEEARAYGTPLATIDGVSAFARYLSDTLNPSELASFAQRLAERPPETPMLLLYAREDPMVPPSVGPRLAQLLPRAQFEWLDDSSHFAHVDTPELVLDHVLPFLR